MIDTKALDNVVELNRLSIGEFCKPNDILWIEGQQAAAQLKQLKKDCAWEEHLRENAETSYSAVYNMNLDQVEQIAQLRSDLEEAREVIRYLRFHPTEVIDITARWLSVNPLKEGENE